MKKELAKSYQPKDFEDRIYAEWMEKGCFHAEVDSKKQPYTIVIPPPNITGQLTRFGRNLAGYFDSLEADVWL